MTVVVSELVHGQGCPCERCTGFQPGNVTAVKHGSYSRRLLAGVAAELAAEIEQVVPDASSPVVSFASMLWAQLHRAVKALDEAPAGANTAELERNALRWSTRFESLLAGMGLLRDPKTGALVNISLELSRSPEWLELQGRIIGALAPYPDVLDAVVVAIGDGSDAAG